MNFKYQYSHIYNDRPTGFKGSRHCIFGILSEKNISNKVLEYVGPKIQFVSQIVAYFFIPPPPNFQITRDYPILLSRLLNI